MFRELLLKFGLVQPTSSDIINKIFKDNFTKSELKDLSTIRSIKIEPTNSDIHGIILFYNSWNHRDRIRIQYHSNSDFILPTCADLAKYLPEIMDAIKETKRILPAEVSKHNEHIKLREEYYNRERTCRTKLWEYINSK